MSRFTKLMLTAVLGLAVVAPVASARPGRFFVGGYFGPAYYGPAWYGYGWGPYWGPYGYAYGYAPGPAVGSVKFETKAKDAAVYVDGGYAGTVAQLKTFKLHAGTHNIELRSPDGNTFYQERVDVVAGKTLKIAPTPGS